MSLTTDWVGQLLSGRYEVVARLGQGGMGSVYQAHDHHLDCDVVIKVPHPAMFADPEFAGRFTREIRSLVRLAHAHVVKISDVGEHQHLPFAVMQYLSGGNLRQRQGRGADGKRKTLTVAEVCRCLDGIADALDFIHSQGCIHRDVKPDNILFDAHGHVYLSDFGVAKAQSTGALAEHASLQTLSGTTVGTPHYMAPELFLGETYDGRVDQYALAVTVYELLSGETPFQGATPAAIALQQMNHPPRPLADFVPAVTPAVSAAVYRALAKDPLRRYPDCRSFLAALRTSGRPAPVGLPAGTRARRTSLAEAPLPPVVTPVTTDPQMTVQELPSTDAPCPSCGALFHLPPTLAPGKRLRCPGCKAVFEVPRRHSSDTGPQSQAATLRGNPKPSAQRQAEPPPPRSGRPLLLTVVVLFLVFGPALGVLYGEQWYRKGWSWYYHRAATAAREKKDWDRVIACCDEMVRVDPQRADAFAQRAEAHLVRSDYELALADADRAVQLDPKLAQAVALRGGAAARTGDFDRAIEDCTRALSLDPKLAVAYAYRAAAHHNRGDSDRALADCNEAIRLQPKLAIAFAVRADIYNSRSDTDKAVADCHEAIRLDDKLTLAYALRGFARVVQQDYDQAVEDFDRAVRLNDREPEIYNARGLMFEQRREFDLALGQLDRAIKLAPRFANYWAYRANVHYDKGEAAEALADAEEAVKLAPRSMLVLNLRGELHLRQNHLDLALRDADAVLSLDEKFAPAQVLRGRILTRQGQRPAARDAYTKAIDLDERNGKAYLYRGQVYLSEQSFDAALADINKSIELLSPHEQAQAYSTRARLHIQMRDKEPDEKKKAQESDEAIKDYTEAIRRNDRDRNLYVSRGEIYRFPKGEYDKAIADFSRAIELDPKRADAYAYRGESRRMKNAYADAIADFDTSIELQKNFAFAYASRGAAYWQQKEYDKAIADLTKAIDLNKNNAFAYHIRSLTWKAKGEEALSRQDREKAGMLDQRYK